MKDRVAKSVLGSQRKKQNPILSRIYPSALPGLLKALIIFFLLSAPMKYTRGHPL